MSVILGRGPHHRRTAYVDHLDAGRRLERIEVRYHQIDRVNAVGLQIGPMGRIVPVGQDPTVDARMKRHHPVPQHDRRTRVVGHIHHRQPRGRDRVCGAPARDQFPTNLDQPRGQLDHARLVVDRDQRPRLCTHEV